jgi:hypothetical protein
MICLASCKKDVTIEPGTPKMTYTDLSSKVINITTPAGVDINGDGASDVWFEIFHTRNKNLKQDVHRFVASPSEESKLLVNDQNGTPIINNGNGIYNIQNAGYLWETGMQTELATRTLIEGEALPTWEGAWKDVQHKYLAVQVTKNGLVYNGWIELSFDTPKERIVLYRSGLSQEAGVAVVAGK